MALPSGTRLGPYEIVGSLGAGGMGEVYRARDTRLNRAVALKVLATHLAEDEAARGRFDREARAIAALSHPHICTLFDVGAAEGGAADGHAYLVMELLEGETLETRLLRGALPLNELIDQGAALADALDTAHRAGLIHRDLKPANIFLTDRGVAKILDFGLARAIELNDDHDTRMADGLTKVGVIVGTSSYMSPEQLRGDTLDARTDLFSLGLVLYEMATGQRAFTGPTTAVIQAAILAHQPAAPSSLRGEIPPRLEETILKALEKDRTLRCQTAAELRADLLRIRRNSDTRPPEPAPSPAVPAVQPSVPAAPSAVAAPTVANRHALMLALVLAGVVVGGVAVWNFARRDLPAEQASAATRPDSATATLPPTAPVVSAPPTDAPPVASPPIPPPAAIAEPPVPPAPMVNGRGPLPTPQPSAGPSPVTRGEPSGVSPSGGDVRPEFGRRGPNAAPLRRGGGRAGAPRAGGRGNPALALENLTAVLTGLPPQSCEIRTAAEPGPRANAVDFQRALADAGWTCTIAGDAPGDVPTFTVMMPRSTRSTLAVVTWARRTNLNPVVRTMPGLDRVRFVIGMMPQRPIQ